MMEQNWLDGFWNKIEKKLSVVAPQVATPFPYLTSEEGKWVPFSNAAHRNQWWTNGFWTGMMWLAYQETRKETYKNIAMASEKALDQGFLDFVELHHDVGFMWLLSAVAHDRLESNPESRARGMHAATLLAGRYNFKGGFIRAWQGKEHTGTVIIDSMMNIPLLYWAYEVSGDPRFEDIATTHADTVMKYFIRGDGSVNHIVKFDPATGEMLDNPRGQGYASGSSWSRGQAWAIYGFVLSYIHTGNDAYLQAAKRVAHYFIANLPGDGVPVIDFRAPKEPVWKDTTAGAIALCGMIEIAKCVAENEKELYSNTIRKMLEGLEENCDFSLDTESILQNGSESYHAPNGHHIPIIYGDYYLMEAILKLKGNEILFW